MHDDLAYLMSIIGELFVALVCAAGAAWLASLARQAWREWRAGRGVR